MTLRVRRFSIANLLADPYRLLLIAAVLLYVVIFTNLAFDLHNGMRTHKADLGQMDQAIWNTSRGRFVEAVNTDIVASRLTDHVEPIFALISPVFWVWNDVRALLLLQVVMAAVGAFPLYALALEKLNQLLSPADRGRIWQRDPVEQLTRPLALALALAYLLAPQLQAALLTEFHAIPLSAPLILWAFWAVERRRWWQFAIAALLVTAVKEEAALLGAGLGAWAMWRIALEKAKGKRQKAKMSPGGLIPIESRSSDGSSQSPITNHQSLILASGVTILSLIWFYVATFVIVPAHAVQVYDVAESTYFQRYGALGGSPLDIVRSFFTQPQLVWQIATEPARADYFWGLVLVFGFLCLLAPEILLLCLPILLANQLSAYPAQYYGEFHYSAPLIPYFAVAAAYGTARLWRFLARRSSGRSGSFQHMPASSAPMMAFVSIFTNAATTLRPLLTWGLVIWLLAWSGWHYVEAGLGPGGGRYSPTPITEHHRLLPGFVNQLPADAAVSATAAVHPHVSHRRYVYQFPLGVEPNEVANWALLDVTTNTDMAPGDLKAVVERMLARDWGIVDAADGFLLMRRGGGDKEIPAAFYDFARVEGLGTGEEEKAKGKRQSAKVEDGSSLASAQSDRNSQSAIRNPASFGPLTFLGVELEDWPRWRQTKVTTIWQVNEDFVPGTVRPWMEIRTPDGDRLHSFGEISPPALVWYPPERWQAGDVVRIQSLWHFLPRVWGVTVGAVHGPDAAAAADRLPVVDNPNAVLVDETATLATVAAFQRQDDDTLTTLPTATVDLSLAEGGIRSSFGVERSAQVTAIMPESVAAGGMLDLRMMWQLGDPGLLERYVPFVHLRQDGQTIAQRDGRPRFFVTPPLGQTIPDWRQIPVPVGATGVADVVIGLFDPSTGERIDVFDAAGRPVGNELSLGQVTILPPLVPDQACALIPAACASQSR